MTPDPKAPSGQLATRSPLLRLIGACVILLVVIGSAASITAATLEHGFTSRSWWLALAAGSVCFLAAAFSLVISFVGNRLNYPVQGVLAGMLVRMGLPLVALVLCRSDRTLGTTILIVYLLALIVETYFALRLAGNKGHVVGSETKFSGSGV